MNGRVPVIRHAPILFSVPDIAPLLSRDYLPLGYLPLMESNSMSKIRVELGPMSPPAPREP